MNKMYHKFLAAVLAVVMCLGISVPAFAATEQYPNEQNVEQKNEIVCMDTYSREWLAENYDVSMDQYSSISSTVSDDLLVLRAVHRNSEPRWETVVLPDGSETTLEVTPADDLFICYLDEFTGKTQSEEETISPHYETDHSKSKTFDVAISHPAIKDQTVIFYMTVTSNYSQIHKTANIVSQTGFFSGTYTDDFSYQTSIIETNKEYGYEIGQYQVYYLGKLIGTYKFRANYFGEITQV